MLTKLQNITKTIFSDKMFESINVDEILDSRDCSTFDSQWVNANNNTQNFKKTTIITAKQEKIIDEIREEVYKIVFRKSQSSDLSSYISDDFYLIAEAICVNSDDYWISALLYKYTQGTIPCDNLDNNSITLKELLESFDTNMIKTIN